MDKPKRILVVDDEDLLRDSLRDMLEMLGHEPETARDGIEALAKLTFDFDLILLDVMMPGMDGYEIARRIRQDPEKCDIPIVMVTGLTSMGDRLRAVEAGANDFIAKPFDLTELKVRTDSLLRMKEAQDAIKKHKSELEITVDKRTEALRKTLDNLVSAQRKLHGAYLEVIQRLAIAAEFKDENTAAHIQRMSRFSALLAKKLGMSPGDIELILHASPMHDVGKIGVDETILLKPGKLTEDEWEIMRQHTIIGSHILQDSSSKLLQVGEIVAISHHENWNGSGYPNGLLGDKIPLWGRICSIADVFDAVTSERPYKKAFSNEEALKILHEGSGEKFDPKLVNLFIEEFDSVIAIQKAVKTGDEILKIGGDVHLNI